MALAMINNAIENKECPHLFMHDDNGELDVIDERWIAESVQSLRNILPKKGSFEVDLPPYHHSTGVLLRGRCDYCEAATGVIWEFKYCPGGITDSHRLQLACYLAMASKPVGKLYAYPSGVIETITLRVDQSTFFRARLEIKHVPKSLGPAPPPLTIRPMLGWTIPHTRDHEALVSGIVVDDGANSTVYVGLSCCCVLLAYTASGSLQHTFNDIMTPHGFSVAPSKLLEGQLDVYALQRDGSLHIYTIDKTFICSRRLSRTIACASSQESSKCEKIVWCVNYDGSYIVMNVNWKRQPYIGIYSFASQRLIEIGRDLPFRKPVRQLIAYSSDDVAAAHGDVCFAYSCQGQRLYVAKSRHVYTYRSDSGGGCVPDLFSIVSLQQQPKHMCVSSRGMLYLQWDTKVVGYNTQASC
jgi:hypothetical protein